MENKTKNPIVTNVNTVNDLINQNKLPFFIPIYQRNYSWKENNIDDLIGEIIENSNDNNPYQYFGSFAIARQNIDGQEVIKLIDGQQRITTILLIYKAVFDVLTNELGVKGKELPLPLQKVFINPTIKLEDRLINGSKIELEQKALSFILSDDIKDDNIETMLNKKDVNGKTKSSYADTNVIKNYHRIVENLNNYLSNFFTEETSKEKVNAIEKLFLNFNSYYQVALVEFSLDMIEEMQIFQNLNSKGEPLSLLDLIKNSIFLKIKPSILIDKESDIDLIFRSRIDFNNRFTTQNLKGNEDKESEFMRSLLVYKSPEPENIGGNPRALLSAFDKIFANENNLTFDEYEKFIANISKYLDIYASILTHDYEKDMNNFLYYYSPHLWVFQEKHSLLPILYYLIDVYFKYEPHDFAQENYNWNRSHFFEDNNYDSKFGEACLNIEKWIIGKVQRGGDGQTLDNARIALRRYIDEHTKEMNINEKREQLPSIIDDWIDTQAESTRQYMPNKELFRDSLKNNEIKGSNQEIIVKRIEFFILNGSKRITGKAPIMPTEKGNIEHIWPQEFRNQKTYTIAEAEDEGKDPKDENVLKLITIEADKMINRLGNLIWLEEKVNKSVSNSAFATKRSQYFNKKLVKTTVLDFPFGDGKTINTEKDWTFKDIEERSESLADILIDKIYYPNEK
ncbi:DUF262 domain-containing protein [Mesoplasma lactucae]|uniref:Uncharacterized protein n=1 Tax=Mesoplasma lactucae ATCC 49193 TaxID=81460 RepID=A0A291ISY2_9MOLU|nr:DUF262 domain-containing protein [Mesoplasma lactucae]ATG97801.1 hypothetical protein CP520_03635 [Mesoplasma lactucae ATCC 49193]ATZ20420.1 hypothetical protein MLACT_v1c05990 [Mesoplasma lactucae ATCC 49193]MCL8216592.1 hypothetical protein [Mesoplasma lactucae ATCC 49193]